MLTSDLDSNSDISYGAEAWTLKQEQRENIEAFEMWCYRRALRISYVEHVSNDEALSRMSQSRKLLSRVKSRKLKYFGHVARCCVVYACVVRK